MYINFRNVEDLFIRFSLTGLVAVKIKEFVQN